MFPFKIILVRKKNIEKKKQKNLPCEKNKYNERKDLKRNKSSHFPKLYKIIYYFDTERQENNLDNLLLTNKFLKTCEN